MDRGDFWRVGDIYQYADGERVKCVEIVPECYMFGEGGYHEGCPGRPHWISLGKNEPSFDYCPAAYMFGSTGYPKRISRVQETIEDRVRRITETIKKEVYGNGGKTEEN
jgi:hypothetical protein